jgi:hypothetical protein
MHLRVRTTNNYATQTKVLGIPNEKMLPRERLINMGINERKKSVSFFGISILLALGKHYLVENFDTPLPWNSNSLSKKFNLFIYFWKSTHLYNHCNITLHGLNAHLVDSWNLSSIISHVKVSFVQQPSS